MEASEVPRASMVAVLAEAAGGVPGVFTETHSAHRLEIVLRERSVQLP